MTKAEHAKRIHATLKAAHKALNAHHEALRAAAAEYPDDLGDDVVAAAAAPKIRPNDD